MFRTAATRGTIAALKDLLEMPAKVEAELERLRGEAEHRKSLQEDYDGDYRTYS